ncbi:hypothetical protein CC80DRAFT_143187 [Byssothecium circinans]|uniref:CFEM domain-containing protein n=1 Tax=Byssothecium circinans TaxID=147558 RepID=A0A6A5TXH0_9PLEO|nr:hypothetical protein CC80DRAFT_143187 [Byssothecium circinans]
MKGSIALLVSGLATQQVAATWNRQATNYNTPQYNNNECSDKQNKGFDWSDLKEGQKDFDYGDFKFGGGWSCSNKFGKRDLLTKRTFNSKCVKNTVSKEKPATFSCDKRKEGFSVKEIDVSVDHDVDLTFHYKMGDGSICKHTAPCKKEGTTVKNTQCGGARSVEVYLGNSKEGKKSCDIGLHRIGFDCTPGKTYNPIPPYTPAPPKSSSTQPPKTSSVGTTSKASSTLVSSSSYAASSSSKASSSSAASSSHASSSYSSVASTSHASSSTLSSATKPSTPATSSVVSSSSQASSSTASSSKPASSSASSSSIGYTPVSSVPSVPASSKPTTSTPAGSTTTPASSSIGYTPVSSVPSVPASSKPISSSAGSSSVGYTPVSSVPSAPSTPAGSTTAPASSKPSTPVVSSTPSAAPSGPAYPPASPPDVLPKCLNTWLQINTQCKDNTDNACYCKIPDFTKNVIDCVASYSTTEEAQKALQYFIGICAADVPKNPGIVSNCPSNIPINPTTPVAAPPPAGTKPATTYAPGSASVPVQAPSPSAPVQAPAPSAPISAPAPGVPSTTVLVGSTTYTVPQVVFSTGNPSTVAPGAPAPSGYEPINLVPGTTPAPAPATTTGAPYPVPSGLTSVVKPTGTGAVSPSKPAELFPGAASSLQMQIPAAFVAVLAFFAL